MDLDLAGQVAVVTGASTGIGRATAVALASKGVRVVGVSRRPPEDEVEAIAHFAAGHREPDAPRRDCAKSVSAAPARERPVSGSRRTR